jgi:nucleotide-binding universal stress UspA family protein
LEEAVKIAKEGKCAIMLLHVVDELLVTPTPEAVYDATAIIESLREAGAEVLRSSADAVRNAGLTAETELVECVGGRAADIIVERAKAWRADLIVLGTHGRRGVRRLVMGSDAEEVVRLAPVPVLLVRPSATEARTTC